jgi:hypothetical protein
VSAIRVTSSFLVYSLALGKELSPYLSSRFDNKTLVALFFEANVVISFSQVNGESKQKDRKIDNTYTTCRLIVMGCDAESFYLSKKDCGR